MASEEFLQEYVVEVKEHLQDLERSLLALERDGRVSEEIGQMFRAAHSIKGASAYMGFEGLANLTHELETLISQLQGDSCSISSKGISVLLQCVDHISGALEHLERAGEEPPLPGLLIEQLQSALEQKELTVESSAEGSPALQSFDLQDSDFDFDFDLSVAPDFPESTPPSAPETSAEPASLGQSEESGTDEEDPELLSIFLDSFQAYFDELAAILSSSSDKLLPDADYERINDLLKRLIASSQYMDYEEIVSRLTEWEGAIRHNFRSGGTDRQTLIGLVAEYGHLLKEVLPALDLTILSRGDAPSGQPPTETVKEEDEDEELLTIYMDSFQQQLDALATLGRSMIEDPDEPSSMPQALDIVRRLISSSRYMDYESVANTLEEWESSLLDSAPTGLESAHALAGSIGVYGERLKLHLPDLRLPLRPSHDSAADPPPPTAAALEEEIDRSFDLLEPSMIDAAPSTPESAGSPDGHATPASGQEPGDTTGSHPVPESPTASTITIQAEVGPDKERVYPERSPSSPEEASAASTTLRVDAQKVDQLLNQVGELVVARSEFIQTSLSFRDLIRELTSQGKLSKQELRKLKALGFTLNENTLSLGRIANNLQGSVMRVRMLPVSQIFQRFPRIVRDQAMRLEKKVNLLVEGGETEIDKTVLEQMYDPLVQFLRNAIAHGIEPPGERKKAGKPETGSIRLAAYHEGDYVTLEVEDDGRGIDMKRLRKAIESREELSAHELGRLSDSELSYAIFLPGLSTHDRIDGHAGRGVGLDVVKENVERMNGTIEVETHPGRGTRFIIRIPLTLAIIRALLVRGGEQVFTIPLSSVVEIMRFDQEKTHTLEGFEVISLHGRTVPLVHLSRLLNLRSTRGSNGPHRFIVIVSTSFREVGVVVDGLMGEREVVIKSLDDGVHVFKGFSGATILGDGTVSLILDVSTLIRTMNEAMASQGKAAGQSIH